MALVDATGWGGSRGEQRYLRLPRPTATPALIMMKKRLRSQLPSVRDKLEFGMTKLMMPMLPSMETWLKFLPSWLGREQAGPCRTGWVKAGKGWHRQPAVEKARERRPRIRWGGFGATGDE